jgi:glycosyltransferase involved in cell wall biosynthesis
MSAKGSIRNRLEAVARRDYDYPNISEAQLQKRLERSLKNYRKIAQSFQELKIRQTAIVSELQRIEAARQKDIVHLEVDTLTRTAADLGKTKLDYLTLSRKVNRLRFNLQRIRLDMPIVKSVKLTGFSTLVDRAKNLDRMVNDAAKLIPETESNLAALQAAADWGNRVLSGRNRIRGGFSKAGVEELFAIAYGWQAPTSNRRSALQELIKWANQSRRPELEEVFKQHLEFARVKRSLSRVPELNFVAHQTARQAAKEQEPGEEYFVLLQTGRLVSEKFHADNSLWVSNFVGKFASSVMESSDISEAQIEWINESLRFAGLAPISLSLGDVSAFDRLECQASPRLTQDDDPLVTVIMPAFNSAAWLSTAVSSVLAQTWRKLELIIVDDASTDSTLATAKYFEALDSRVRVIALASNAGPYHCRNVALRVSNGHLITVHDADDWSHPQKIERQVEHLLSNPEVLANLSQGARMEPNSLQVGLAGRTSILRPNFSSLMFRRDPVLNDLGFWDEVRFGGDSEFQTRITAFYGADALRVLAPSASAMLRVVANSLTAGGVQEMLTGARRLYKESFLAWHTALKETGQSFYLNPNEPRRFYAPRASLNQSLDLVRHDLVMAANLAAESHDLDYAKNLTSLARELGLSVGVVHVPSIQDATARIDLDFEAYCCSNRVELLQNLESEIGEPVTFDAGLVLSTVGAAQEIFDRIPSFSAEKFALLLTSQRSNHGPKLSRAIANFEIMYRAKPELVAADREARSYFDQSATEINEMDAAQAVYRLANQGLFQGSGD